MLSAANAEFAAREAAPSGSHPGALPGLAALLDPEEMAARLRAEFAAVENVEPIYIRHKSGSSSLVLYRARTAAGPRFLFARTFASGAGGKLSKARRLADAVFDDINAAVFAFPNDPSLPALARLADPDARAKLLGRVFRSEGGLAAGSLGGLAYKPMRRYVARLDLAGEARAVVKFHSEAEFEAKAAVSKRISGDGGGLVTPRLLGASTRHRAIAYAWIDGAPLDAALTAGAPTRIAPRVGAALRALHGQRNHGLPFHGLPGVLDDVDDQARAIGGVLPDLAATATDIADRVRAGLGARRPERRLVHGDFSAAQVLRTEAGVAIIDIDEMHVGDPALDLAHFIADLDRGRIAGRWSAEVASDFAAGFLDGYAAAGGEVPTREIGAYVAWGLMRLALEPFRRLTPDWPGEVAALVGRAARLADGSADPRAM